MQKRIVLSFIVAVLFSGPALAQDVFDAARKGNVQQLEVLVKINPDTVNARNASDFTPLIIAGYNNQLSAVVFLLKHQAAVNADSPEGPVILGACYKGNLELTQLLIDNRADVNAQNGQGTSALIYAVLSDNVALVKLLLAQGADKNHSERSGRTALSYAQLRDAKEMIGLLTK